MFQNAVVFFTSFLAVAAAGSCNCPWQATVQNSLEYAHDALSVYITDEVHLYDPYEEPPAYYKPPYYGSPNYDGGYYPHSDPYHRRDQYYKGGSGSYGGVSYGSGSYGGGSYGDYPSSYGHPPPYNGPYEHPTAYDPDFPIGKYHVYAGTVTYAYKGCTWKSKTKILVITDRDRYGCGVDLDPKTQYVLFGYPKKIENIPGYGEETALYISKCSANVPALSLTAPDKEYLAGIKEPYCPPKSCNKDGDCAHGYYCAAGTCLVHGSCEITSDCFNPVNDKGVDPLCDKFQYTCSDHTCSSECCDDSQCDESPCSTASCDEEYVKCVDDVCGSCTARFFNVKGEEVCKSKVDSTVCIEDANCGSEEYCAAGVCQAYGLCHTDEDCYNPANYLGKDERGLVDRKCVKSKCSYDYCPIEYCSIRPCYDVYCDADYVSCVDDYCDCTPHFFNLAGESVCEASYEYKTPNYYDSYDTYYPKPEYGDKPYGPYYPEPKYGTEPGYTYGPYHRRTSAYGPVPYYHNEPPKYESQHGYGGYRGPAYYPSEPSYDYGSEYSSEHSYYNHYPDHSPYPYKPEYKDYYPSRPSYDKEIYYPKKQYKDPVASGENVTVSCESDRECSYGEYCAAGTCRAHGTCATDDDCYNLSNFLGKGIRGLAFRRCVTGGVCGVSECHPANCPTSPCEMLYKACSEDFVTCVDDFCDGCGAKFFNLKGERVCEDVTADDAVIDKYLKAYPDKPEYPSDPSYDQSYPSRPEYGPYYAPATSYEHHGETSYPSGSDYRPRPDYAYYGSPYHRRASEYYPSASYEQGYHNYYPMYDSGPSYGYESSYPKEDYNHYPDHSPYPYKPEYKDYYPSRPSYDKEIYYPKKQYKDPVASGENVTVSCESDRGCSYGEYCAAGTCRSHGTCATDDDCYNLSNFLGKGIRGLAFRRCVTGGVCGVSECHPANCPASPCEMLYKACSEDYVTCVDDFCDGCGAKFFNAKGERVCEDVTADDAVIDKYLKAYPEKPEYSSYYPQKPEYSPYYPQKPEYSSYYPQKPEYSPDYPQKPEYDPYYPSDPSYGDHYPSSSTKYDPYYPHGPAYGGKPPANYHGVPAYGEPAVEKYPSKTEALTTCKDTTDCSSGEYCAAGLCRAIGTCEISEDCYNKYNVYGTSDRGTMTQMCSSGVCQSETCDLATCSASPCAYATCDEAYEYCVDDYCGACGAKFFNAEGLMVCNYEHRA